MATRCHGADAQRAGVKIPTSRLDPVAPVSSTRTAIRFHAARVARFALSVALAGLVTILLIGAIPNLLPNQTDIVGYPIHHPFDVRRYFATYALWLTCFPALAAVSYFALGRFHLFQPARPHGGAEGAPPVPVAAAPPVRSIATASAAMFLATAPLAIALGVIAFARWQHFGRAIIVASLLATGFGFGVAALIRLRAQVSARSAIWAVVALVAPGAFLALSLLSSRTGIYVVSLSSFQSVTWFPWWLGGTATMAGTAVVGVFLARVSSARWPSVGRWALVVCSVPAVLWMLLGGIQPGITPGDLFHEGEILVGAQQLLDGDFPWRDFYSAHGLLLDSFLTLPGLALVDHSSWGAQTGALIWAVPLYWLSSFAFAAYIFRRNLLLVAAWCAFAIASPVAAGLPLFAPHWRSVFYPLILLAMAWVVRRPGPLATGVMSLLLVLQVVLTPEMAYLVPALFVVLVAFDWVRHPGVTIVRRFPTTLLTAAWCTGFGLLFVGFLALNGALGSFVGHFLLFAGGHELTGGLPLTEGDIMFRVSVLLPPILFLVAIWYAISRMRARRPFDQDDWVLAPAVLFGVLYYSKFLGRADLHSIQTLAVVTPLLWYLVTRLLASADQAWRRARPGGCVLRHGVTVVAVLVSVVLLGPGLNSRAQQTPDRYRAVALERSSTPRLGYSSGAPAATGYDRAVADASATIAAISPGNPKVFDFSNSPELFYFTMGLEPPTRFSHVSMAIPQAGQRELIDDLRESRPEVVVASGETAADLAASSQAVAGRPGVEFTAGPSGMSIWDDIPNMVRHYDVNRYLLTHYRAVVGVGTYTYLLRNDLPFDPAVIDGIDLSVAPRFTNLDEGPLPCDWGAAPQRFAPGPAPGATRRSRLQLTRVDETLRITGWAADLATGKPATEVVALSADGTVIGSAVPGDVRPDIAGLPGHADALHAGFRLNVPVASGESFVIAARGDDGVLSPLGGLSGDIDTVVPGSSRRLRGRVATVGSREAGAIEKITTSSVPDGVRAVRFIRPGTSTDWNWLELRSPTPLSAGSYSVGVPAGAGPIRFRVVGDGQRSLDVMVGACNQWYTSSDVEVISFPDDGPNPTVGLAS